MPTPATWGGQLRRAGGHLAIFAGKEYEEALGQGVVPARYVGYLELLRDVLGECVRVLEPGGRIAVNVANLGRRPYR